MSNSVPEHEKLFDEICNKLNELSSSNTEGEAPSPQPKYELMQVQMKRFQSELVGSQVELREKIRNLESVSYGPETLDAQMKHLADQLSAERGHNTKLSADLAKSLELSLQLQLEIQGLKARSLQVQSEEKKYSQALFDKCKALQRDLELAHALREEISIELQKAKSSFSRDEKLWGEQRELLEREIHNYKKEQQELQESLATQKNHLEERDQTIQILNGEIEKISQSYSEVESSAQQQTEVLKNLMSVAEAKIVDMKLALDKKSLEAQDYYSHLQQALTQLGVLKQENGAMKEYVAKLNFYHQQAQQAQMAVAQMAQAAANQVQQPLPKATTLQKQ
jgi:hypothetical protein